MRKRKLKPFVLPTIYVLGVVSVAISLAFLPSTVEDKEDTYYVNDSILNTEIPVINMEILITKPYIDEDISIGRYFYNYKGTEEEQKSALVYHENMYMPNSGVDYVRENVFDVVAILDGVVISVEEKELLGTTIEIKHSNNLISVYQSLSEVNVKKDDNVLQGQVIAKSGTNEINSSLNNHLHFELYDNGSVVNPEMYYGKKLTDLQ